MIPADHTRALGPRKSSARYYFFDMLCSLMLVQYTGLGPRKSPVRPVLGSFRMLFNIILISFACFWIQIKEFACALGYVGCLSDVLDDFLDFDGLEVESMAFCNQCFSCGADDGGGRIQFL